jgi:heme-degrading monooxygenase HmoA
MSTTPFAATPQPPYYAVIFTSKLSEEVRGYEAASKRMVELGSSYPGFLGIESVRGADGVGITVSYWKDEASIRAWKADPEHKAAQHGGRSAWYSQYDVRIARVERAYSMSEDPASVR